MVNKSHLDQPIYKTLIEGELEMLEKMKGCSNILNLHEIIRDDNFIYIVTELCETDLSKCKGNKVTENIFEKYVNHIIKGFK